ncbi:hypothetical protein GF314_09840 [bacterium]|nr:hypothetical protein [bacterium]
MTAKLRTIALASLLTLALAGAAVAAEHTVDQVGLEFVPAEITIETGDTIIWNWSGGSHTVTSGSSLEDPDLGELFDAPLNADNPSFSFTFDEAGTYPYLCRPHESLDMLGTIIVEQGVANEAATWNAVKGLFR